MTEPTLAIEASNLTKTYPGGRNKPRVQALDDLSFVAEAGTIFGLLGPNGAGKSTTVKILSTLIAGRLRTRASSPASTCAKHPDRVRKAVGFVAQKQVSDPMDTGRENLVLAGQLQGMTTASREGTRRRPARPLQSLRRRRPPGQDLLRRHGAQARRRDRHHAPPAGAVPRRADHRARPRGARRDVGRAREHGPRRGDDRAAHDPLPRGGRPPGQPPRDRRPRPRRRRGHPRAAQGRPARRRRHRRTARRHLGRGGPEGDLESERPQRGHRRGAVTARSRGGGRDCAARCSRGPR